MYASYVPSGSANVDVYDLLTNKNTAPSNVAFTLTSKSIGTKITSNYRNKNGVINISKQKGKCTEGRVGDQLGNFSGLVFIAKGAYDFFQCESEDFRIVVFMGNSP